MNKPNPNCDGAHCTNTNGEVRVISIGGASNLVLCRACYNYELAWRRERNRNLSRDCQFDLPTWDSLEVYKLAE